MLPRLLLLLTLTSTLLVSTSSCSKKDNSATPTPITGTGSYKHDGIAVLGTARVYTSSMLQGSLTTDLLDINIIDTPQPQIATKSLTIVFTKLSGQPTSAYQLLRIDYESAQTSLWCTYLPATSKATLQETSAGVFSCTFSGTGTLSNSTQSTLTDGVITDARL